MRNHKVKNNLNFLIDSYKEIAKRLDKTAVRERALFLLFLCVVIYIVWALFVMFPLKKKNALIEVEKKQLVKQVIQLRQKIAALQVNGTEKNKSDKPPAKVGGDSLISSKETVPLLKTMLAKSIGITVQSVNNLPDQKLIIDDKVGGAALSIPLYMQGIQISYIGNFLNTFDYLRALENSKWSLFWDDFKYNVIKHPNANVTFTMHTVSQAKEE